jgi:hypothetical protein
MTVLLSIDHKSMVDKRDQEPLTFGIFTAFLLITDGSLLITELTPRAAACQRYLLPTDSFVHCNHR